jgi:hypothetical protein
MTAPMNVPSFQSLERQSLDFFDFKTIVALNPSRDNVKLAHLQKLAENLETSFRQLRDLHRQHIRSSYWWDYQLARGSKRQAYLEQQTAYDSACIAYQQLMDDIHLTLMGYMEDFVATASVESLNQLLPYLPRGPMADYYQWHLSESLRVLKERVAYIEKDTVSLERTSQQAEAEANRSIGSDSPLLRRRADSKKAELLAIRRERSHSLSKQAMAEHLLPENVILAAGLRANQLLAGSYPPHARSYANYFRALYLRKQATSQSKADALALLKVEASNFLPAKCKLLEVAPDSNVNQQIRVTRLAAERGYLPAVIDYSESLLRYLKAELIKFNGDQNPETWPEELEAWFPTPEARKEAIMLVLTTAYQHDVYLLKQSFEDLQTFWQKLLEEASYATIPAPKLSPTLAFFFEMRTLQEDAAKSQHERELEPEELQQAFAPKLRLDACLASASKKRGVDKTALPLPFPKPVLNRWRSALLSAQDNLLADAKVWSQSSRYCGMTFMPALKAVDKVRDDYAALKKGGDVDKQLHELLHLGDKVQECLNEERIFDKTRFALRNLLVNIEAETDHLLTQKHLASTEQVNYPR